MQWARDGQWPARSRYWRFRVEAGGSAGQGLQPTLGTIQQGRGGALARRFAAGDFGVRGQRRNGVRRLRCGRRLCFADKNQGSAQKKNSKNNVPRIVLLKIVVATFFRGPGGHKQGQSQKGSACKKGKRPCRACVVAGKKSKQGMGDEEGTRYLPCTRGGVWKSRDGVVACR